jgi:hypothetical protein
LCKSGGREEILSLLIAAKASNPARFYLFIACLMMMSTVQITKEQIIG